MWLLPFFNIIYDYGYIHFICLIHIQKCINTEIYTVYRKSAKK